MNILIERAIKHATESGNAELIRSNTIKVHLLGAHKDHNSVIQKMISQFDVSKVFPQDPQFYDWKVEYAKSEPAAEQTQTEGEK